MKKIIPTLTATCLPLLSQQHWIDLPDGYQWETPLKNSPKFATSTVSTNLFSASFQEAVSLHWSGPELPKQLEIFEIDLNGDDQREIFIAVPKLGGSGGMSYTMLSPSDDGFRYLGSVLGFGFEFLSAKNGWLQIKGYSRGGGGQHTRYLLQHLETEYQTVRIENHDLNRKKVQIRTPK